MEHLPLPEGVELMGSASQADWIRERLTAEWVRERRLARQVAVGAFIPDCFEAYCRVFHPAELGTKAGEYERVQWSRVRWSTVASWNGKVVHPQMQFYRIANLEGFDDIPPWGQPPRPGHLPEEECIALVSTLREFTATPESCYFCVWEGYGGLFSSSYYKGTPRLEVPGREYVVFHGPLDAIRSFYGRWVGGMWWDQSPNIWWPEDRAWCVATEIDFYDTYVDGSRECIEQVLTHPDLEALPIDIDYSLRDTINQ